jgi:hypothetical protein
MQAEQDDLAAKMQADQDAKLAKMRADQHELASSFLSQLNENKARQTGEVKDSQTPENIAPKESEKPKIDPDDLGDLDGLDVLVDKLDTEGPEKLGVTISKIIKDIKGLQNDALKARKGSLKQLAKQAELKRGLRIVDLMVDSTRNTSAAVTLKAEITQATSDFVDSARETGSLDTPADGDDPSDNDPSDDDSSLSSYDSDDPDAAQKNRRELRIIKKELKRTKGHNKRSKSSDHTLSSKRDPT